MSTAAGRSGARALIGLLGLVLSGCGGGPGKEPAVGAPQTESSKADVIVGLPPGWSDANTKSAELYRAGKYTEALAVLEAFAREHPSFDQVELTLGDTYLAMPSDRDATANRERLEKAAAHFQRGLELARESDTRRWGESALLRIYGPEELDRAADAEPVARAFTKDHPSEAKGYAELASALRRLHKPDDATRILREASSRIGEADRNDYVEALVTHADESPSLPPSDQRQLLADASPVVDTLLNANAKDVQALRIKARMVAVEARLEPNAAKRKMLEAESKRLGDASNDALFGSIRR